MTAVQPTGEAIHLWWHHGFGRDEGDIAWMADAACRTTPTETFYPDAGQHRHVAAAKAVCADCPVVAECLAYALEHGEPGVWGGTTANERRRMRKPKPLTKPVELPKVRFRLSERGRWVKAS